MSVHLSRFDSCSSCGPQILERCSNSWEMQLKPQLEHRRRDCQVRVSGWWCYITTPRLSRVLWALRLRLKPQVQHRWRECQRWLLVLVYFLLHSFWKLFLASSWLALMPIQIHSVLEHSFIQWVSQSVSQSLKKGQECSILQALALARLVRKEWRVS